MDWHTLRILLTGGAGFLGSHVARRLQEHGCILDSSQHIPRANSNTGRVYIPRSRHHDLVEPNVAKHICDIYRPQLIIHLAARTGGIGANRARPAEFCYQNLMIGTQLLHAAHQYKVPKFVGIGTICAYPRDTPVPFTEDKLWDGYPEPTNAPYGLAKKMLLVQGQAYRDQYGMNVTHLLPVNLYGPGDNFNTDSSHVIPALIRKLMTAKEYNQEQVEVWGSGSATREFLYVDDAARAILLATEHYSGHEPVNIGSGQEINIRALVLTLRELTGYQGEIIWDSSKPDGQPRRCLDTSKAQALFGFQASTPFRAGLEQTINWYREHRR